MQPPISVIIPTLNEEHFLAQAICSAKDSGIEDIIVVDGCSQDRTREIAVESGVRLFECPANRGAQQNLGAAESRNEVLLFLHADTRITPAAVTQVCEVYSQPNWKFWGGFRQRIENRRLPYRMIETGNFWRAKYRKLVYGDQGIFVSRSLFEQVGGYPDIPLMEDVELSRILSQQTKPMILDGPVELDDRHWKKNGPFIQTLRNWRFFTSYQLGKSPYELSSSYHPELNRDSQVDSNPDSQLDSQLDSQGEQESRQVEQRV